jgi:hypothetical protein
MKTNKLLLVITVTFGVGFLASAYLNFHQHQLASQDKKLLQGEITDLRYQLKQDSVSPSPSTTPDPLPSESPMPSPSPSESPAVAGTNSVGISQLGIKLTASDPVADLTYGMAKSGAYDVAALTTQSLVAKYSGCKPSNTNNALGFVVRKKPGVSSSGELVKRLGDWNYFYVKPSGSCATDAAGNNALAAARAAVKNAVMPTMAQ